MEYAEEMTGYYTEVIEDGEDLIKLKSLTERMPAPLQHYQEAFTNAVKELARQSEDEKLRVEVLRAKGLAGFWTLGVHRHPDYFWRPPSRAVSGRCSLKGKARQLIVCIEGCHSQTF